MTGEANCPQDDLAYLRSIAEGSTQYVKLNGAILIAIGTVFGAGVLRLWAVETELIGWPEPLRSWIPWDMIAIFLVALAVINVRFSRQHGSPSGRAFSAAWTGVGLGILVAVIALSLAARGLNQPFLVANVFPVVLLTLYGSAWLIVFSILRRTWYVALVVGSYATAIGCGFWMGTPAQWLVLGLGIVICAGVPGLLLMRQANSAAA
jgi:hypothetical protein